MMNSYLINDARTLSSVVPPKVDLTITSPPYFDVKDYGSANQIGYGQKYEQYLDDMQKVLEQTFNVTKETGSLWMVVDTLKKDGRLILLPFDLTRVAEKCGWHLQDIIIWKKDKTVPFSHRGEMRNIFEYILFFVKTPKFKHYPERLTTLDIKEWWIKYPERYSITGKGRSDVWEFPIPVQGSWGNSYVRHFCPLPKSMLSDMIELCTDTGDLVLDPFAGTGAVLYEAKRLGRDYIGCDLNPEYKAKFETYLRDNPPKASAIKANGTDVRTLFASTVVKLRAIKYPSSLLKHLKKFYPEEYALINGISVVPIDDLNDISTTSWSVRYAVLVKSLDNVRQLQKIINIISARPPLSKFGIKPIFEFVGQLKREPELSYSVVSPQAIPSSFAAAPTPFIGSNLALNEEERTLISHYLETGTLVDE